MCLFQSMASDVDEPIHIINTAVNVFISEYGVGCYIINTAFNVFISEYGVGCWWTNTHYKYSHQDGWDGGFCLVRKVQ